MILLVAISSSVFGQRPDVDLDDGSGDYAQKLLASHGEDGRILERQARTRPFALGFFGWKAQRLALLPYNRTQAVHLNVCRLVLSVYGTDPQLDPVLTAMVKRGTGQTGFVEATDQEKAVVQQQVVQRFTKEFLFDFSNFSRPQPQETDPLAAWKYSLGSDLGELAGMLTQWFALSNNQVFADSVSSSLTRLDKRIAGAPKEVPANLVTKIRELRDSARATYTTVQKREVAARLAALLDAALGLVDLPPVTGEVAKLPVPTPQPPRATPLPPKPTPVPPSPTPAPPKPTPAPPAATPVPSPIKLPSPAPVPSDDLEAGKQLAAKGDHAGAIKRFTSYLERSPDSVPALLARGVSYYQLKEYQNASSDLRRASTLDPHSPEPHKWLAKVYCAQGFPSWASFQEYEAKNLGGTVLTPCKA